MTPVAAAESATAAVVTVPRRGHPDGVGVRRLHPRAGGPGTAGAVPVPVTGDPRVARARRGHGDLRLHGGRLGHVVVVVRHVGADADPDGDVAVVMSRVA